MITPDIPPGSGSGDFEVHIVLKYIPDLFTL